MDIEKMAIKSKAGIEMAVQVHDLTCEPDGKKHDVEVPCPCLESVAIACDKCGDWIVMFSRTATACWHLEQMYRESGDI